LVLVGAELAEALERLVRRRASMTLAQFRMIELMADRHPGRLEPSRLAETLGLASNHVSMPLDQLEAQARVKRHAHPGDAPRRLIEITASGRQRAARLTGLTHRQEDRG
jgi:DNA-binding MarR family transcriptional regulator